MTVVLDLPPDMELKMREVAQAEGLDVSALVRETMTARLRQYDPSRALTETELLTRINRGFPETFWNRFRDLVAKLKSGSLTLEEQKELISHTDQTENRDAERLVYLLELSKRRGMTVPALMEQLGLRPVSLD